MWNLKLFLGCFFGRWPLKIIFELRRQKRPINRHNFTHNFRQEFNRLLYVIFGTSGQRCWNIKNIRKCSFEISFINITIRVTQRSHSSATAILNRIIVDTFTTIRIIFNSQVSRFIIFYTNVHSSTGKLGCWIWTYPSHSKEGLRSKTRDWVEINGEASEDS